MATVSSINNIYGFSGRKSCQSFYKRKCKCRIGNASESIVAIPCAKPNDKRQANVAFNSKSKQTRNLNFHTSPLQ